MALYEKFQDSSTSEKLFIINKPDALPIIYSSAE